MVNINKYIKALLIRLVVTRAAKRLIKLATEVDLTLRTVQKCQTPRHFDANAKWRSFADGIFKFISLDETCFILIEI